MNVGGASVRFVGNVVCALRPKVICQEKEEPDKVGMVIKDQSSDLLGNPVQTQS
jgi:hypothetical protein